MSKDRCENCLGIETTLGCITAAVDIPGTNIKKGDTLSKIFTEGLLTQINTENNGSSQESSVTTFTPPTIYSTSNCASQLEGSMFKYDVSNTDTISKIGYNFCEILEGFPNSYSFSDQSTKIISKKGQIGSSRGNVGVINVKKDDYPLTISTEAYVETPCGQVKLTNKVRLNSCQQLSTQFSNFHAEDLTHVDQITSPEEYMTNLALGMQNLKNKMNSMEQNPIGCNDVLNEINLSNSELINKCEVLEKQIQEVTQLAAELKLQNDILKNQITDNRNTISSLNNIRSTNEVQHTHE